VGALYGKNSILIDRINVSPPNNPGETALDKRALSPARNPPMKADHTYEQRHRFTFT